VAAETASPQTLDEVVALIVDRRRLRRWHLEMLKSLDAEIAVLEKRAKLARGGRALPDVNIEGIVNTSMVQARRLAISAGLAKGDEFIIYIGDAKREAEGHKRYSLRSLAKALDIPPSLLSMYRSRKNGRACPTSRAKRIERLTGWPAESVHWPNGLTSD
jgi:hypothetical protein